ncbi:MAG: hypothetical protein IJJ61_09905 [Clostridia bacterium]|nr:hypothetical protein [Clostridia bacterium]
MKFEELYTNGFLECFCNPDEQDEDTLQKKLKKMKEYVFYIFDGIAFPLEPDMDMSKSWPQYIKKANDYCKSKWDDGFDYWEEYRKLYKIKYPHNNAFDVPLEELNLDEAITVLIWPFANRMGSGSFEEEFARSGRLGECLLRIKELDNE